MLSTTKKNQLTRTLKDLHSDAFYNALMKEEAIEILGQDLADVFWTFIEAHGDSFRAKIGKGPTFKNKGVHLVIARYEEMLREKEVKNHKPNRARNR